MIETESTGKILTVKAPVKVPRPPNFLSLDIKLGKEGGASHLQELPQIDVADVDDAGLRALGAAWTEELLQNAENRRNARVGRPTPR